jgi:hypothetical protein
MPYPIGEPEVIGVEGLVELLKNESPLPWRKEMVDKVPFKGWILLRIEAPKIMPFNGRLPPFLPYRDKKGSLLFPLCSKCAEMRNQNPCTHNSAQRSWVTAITDLDINLALKLGYTVHEIFEVRKKWGKNIPSYKLIFRFGTGQNGPMIFFHHT